MSGWKALMIGLMFTISCNTGEKRSNVKSLSDSGQKEKSMSQRDRMRLNQYVVRGQELYQTHCSQCHQDNGEGLGKLYPPVANADYLVNNIEKVICGIDNGQVGEILVNGQLYNQPMPAISGLSNLEIAEIMTFLLSKWNGTDTIITQNQVFTILDNCE